MATRIVTGSFTITAAINGSSLYVQPVVVNGPLLQYYDTGNGTVTPDWSPTAITDATKRPTVYPRIVNGTDGDNLLIPNTVTYFYNDVTLTFDSNGKCTTTGYTTTFELVDLSVATGKTLKALRIMTNLASASNSDNDKISISGSVEVGGSSAQFDKVDAPVTIQAKSGSASAVVISVANGVFSVKEGQDVTLEAVPLVNGIEPADLTGYTYSWQKQAVTSGDDDGWDDTVLGTAKTLTVTSAMVDGDTLFRCVVKKDGAAFGIGVTSVRDLSDPLVVRFDGFVSTLQPGQSETITPKLVKQFDNTNVVKDSIDAVWYVRNNTGDNYTLAGQTSHTFTSKNITVSYDDAVKAKSLNISMSTTYTE